MSSNDSFILSLDLLEILILGLITVDVCLNEVLGYSYDVSVTSTSVTVGNSITLRISAKGIGGKFNITSSNSSVASLAKTSIWVEGDEEITISTNKVGTAVITIIPDKVATTDADPKDVALANKAITITVNEKKVAPPPSSGGGNSSPSSGGSYTPKAKSSNNYLSSLTIDNATLSEAFDRELLEYTVTLPNDIEKIKINAQLENSNSHLEGTGEFNVSVGLNTFDIIVTAENGSKRTYKLNVTVLEDEPIKVKINNNEYTVIKKRKDLPKISGYYIEKDYQINDLPVEGYYNESLNYNVIGLKDENGKINFYLYNNNKYEKYQEHTFNGTTLQILDREVSDGYKKTSFKYDNDTIPSYQAVKINILKNTYALSDGDIPSNQFYLFYGKNIETGKINLYQYDNVEKTVQRYNTEILDMYKDQSDKYYVVLLSAILLIGIILISLAIILIKKSSKKKKKSYTYEDINEELEKETSNISKDNILENESENISENIPEDIPIKKSKKKNKYK